MKKKAAEATEEGFRAWMSETGNKPAGCNCGGPQMGTGHSPDCENILSLDDLWEEYKDYLYEQEIKEEEEEDEVDFSGTQSDYAERMEERRQMGLSDF